MCASGYLLNVMDLQNRSLNLEEIFKDYDVSVYKWTNEPINETNQYLKLLLNNKYYQKTTFMINSFNVENYNLIVDKLNNLNLINENTKKPFTIVNINSKPYEIFKLL